MKQLTINGSVQRLAVGVAALLLFLILAPGSAYASVGDEYTVKVDTGFLALRSAPAYDASNEIGELYNGDVVTVEREEGDYWWVYSPKYDKSGYVNKDYLMIASSYGDYTVKVDQNYLALRTEPSFDAGNEIGELYTGDVVTVKDMSNGQYWWVYSPKYDRCGYVNKDYLTDTPSFYGNFKVKVDKGYLALRSAPGYDAANEIGELNNGDVVEVEEKRGGGYWWVYSPTLNREGYVNADYLVEL